MKRWIVLSLLLAANPVFAQTATITKTVTINTDAADFTVIGNVSNRTVRVTKIDVQNIGTSGKIAFQLCDGACGSATSKVGPFELSPATASTQGGGWTSSCSDKSCYWNITPGNAFVGQVNTGATNNVRVSVTYEYYQR